MNVANENTPRPRRYPPPRKPRRTAEFSVKSPEHQRLLLEAIEQRLETEPLRWKQMRLRWMRRRLTEAMEVQGGKRHAR